MPFYNPYGFVPIRDRADHRGEFVEDRNPVVSESRENHSRYWEDRYTGNIPIMLTTKTPLFITDPGSKEHLPGDPEGHFHYKTLPYIPATTLKGLLSTCYEAITNSRYRIFSAKQHKQKLGMRVPANPNLVPGRIKKNAAGTGFEVELFPGTSTLGNPSPLYAAWLPLPPSAHPLSASGLHTATIKKYHHSRGFDFWSVEQIDARTLTPITQRATPLPDSPITVTGHVVTSGKISINKHDERFFFNTGTPCIFQISPDVQKDYEDLVADYQAVHKDGAYPPSGGFKLGDHVTVPDRRNMQDGDFVYAEIKGNAVKAIFPVQISRKLCEKSPWNSVYRSILPAEDFESLECLSPADRLFGWIAQGQGGAWKGKIRLSDGLFSPPNKKLDQNLMEDLDSLPLKILGSPKPSQARFYLGDTNGYPQKAKLSKEDVSYKENKILRGRKFYLHQIPPNSEYWTSPYGGAIQACKAVDGAKSRQNRSLRNWILPDRRFKFNIRVENLTREELGALLTLLTLPDNFCFKLGYAKPLGLGSVRLRLDLPDDADLPVFTGRERAERYCAFDAAPRAGLDANAREDLVSRYKMTMIETYAGGKPPVFPDPPAAPESWRDPQQCPGEGFDLIREVGEACEALGTLWRDTLQKGGQTFPIDALDSAYAELLDANDNEALQKAYSQDKRVYDKDMKAFSKARQTAFNAPYAQLPFIDAFNKALQGKPAQNVYYPQNAPGEEGFKWFSGNERVQGGHLLYAYSLPAMGEELRETL
ncbi:MAG: TIGR03986 family CRISPR-associated RAMP protein [Synergistaceae bacterium]|nr:TIGR03986 family CRISPR-associated RAMP protein [Synergistaceae bacterium]